MKKTISLLLSIVMLVSITVCGNIPVQAADFVNYSQNIQLNRTYTNSASNYDPKVDGASNYSFHSYQFTVPESGTINIYEESANSKYFPWGLYIYDSRNLDNCIWYGTLNTDISYSSTNKVYYNSISTTLKKGTYFLVKEYCNEFISDLWGSYNLRLNYKPNISTPSTLKASTRNTTNLKLSWGKVSGVSGYQLQRKSGDSWKTVATTTSTSSTVKSLKAGTTYSFRVRAYKTINGTKYYSGWRTLKTPTSPSKPAIKTPSTNKKHQITAKWKKVSACSGYQVQYSMSSKFKKATAKTVSGASKTSCTGKFKKGKKYYIRVRSYKTVDGKKYYSAWSSVKSIKCK